MSPSKYADLLVLAASLAVFLLGGLPMLGFAAGAGVWLLQRGIQALAERRANRELAAGNRQRAMATVAVSTLGRVGLMATVVLVAGIVEREAGLSSAVLVAVLFTVSLAAQGIAHLFDEEPQAGKA
ncbi:MAG TPA: hypothetical protein VID51_04105 [Solirubrobacterales bacterium]|jgi:uncharacterized membrane protein YkgB